MAISYAGHAQAAIGVKECSDGKQEQAALKLLDILINQDLVT